MTVSNRIPHILKNIYFQGGTQMVTLYEQYILLIKYKHVREANDRRLWYLCFL